MNTERKGVLAFGELLWDVFPDGAHIGGAPFNLAAHAVRCGLGAQLLSRVGADDLGRQALAEARRLDVGADFVQIDPTHPTGTVSVTLDATGQPTYTIHAPVAWDFIAADVVTLAALRQQRVDAISYRTLAQRRAASRASLRHLLATFPTAPVFFDVNLRQHFFSRFGCAAKPRWMRRTWRTSWAHSSPRGGARCRITPRPSASGWPEKQTRIRVVEILRVAVR